MMKRKKLLLAVIVLSSIILVVLINRCTSSPKELNIIAFGDSNTYGYGLDIEESYPYLLRKKFNGTVRVLNKGISGHTVSDLQSRVEKDVFSFAMHDARNIVLIQIGTNDFGYQYSASRVWSDLDKLWDEVRKRPEWELWAVTVPPRADYAPLNVNIRKLNSLIKKSDKPHRVIDFHQTFFRDDGSLIREMFQEDGLHMTKGANDILVEKIAAAL